MNLKKLVPRGRVFFPKYVCINNPRLALLYYLIVIIIMGIAVFTQVLNRTYVSYRSVSANAYVTTWMLQRPFGEIYAASVADQQKPHCLNPGASDYEYGIVDFTGIQCAPLCSASSTGTCITPGELYDVTYGSDIFIPTIFKEEYNGTARSYFVPAVENRSIAFTHSYMVEEVTDKLHESKEVRTGHSSDTTAEERDQLLTVLLDRDGKEARRWQPGEVIEMNLADVFENALLIEFSADISRLQLDDKYTRVEEGIIDDLSDSGVSVRVTGAEIFVDLEYTNEGSCTGGVGQASSTPIDQHNGKVCCMSIKALRHWQTRRIDNVLDINGVAKLRAYNGIHVSFRTSGRFSHYDPVAILSSVTTLLIWYQIPSFVILLIINSVLGKLSEVYSRVIYQSMTIKEAVTGLGTRLIGHSSAYLDNAETKSEGITKMRMVERFRLIFQDSDELDDGEIVKLVDYIHNSMTGQGDVESDRNVLVENFCLSATSNEPLGFKSIVHIFDKDRRLGFIENVFNDQAIQAIRMKQIEEEEQAHGQGRFTEVQEAPSEARSTDEHSQLDTVGRMLLKLKARHQRLTDKVDKTLREADKTLTKEADTLFDHRRRELAAQGAPESRPPAKMASGATYHGDWVGNTRHGYGTEIWPDGATYEGQWAAGRLHGHAVYRQPNGAKYAGQWINGKQHGKGVHVSESGAKYDGQFQHGLKNGKGKIYLVDGSTYEGEVVDNNMHGPGYYEWVDGKSYKGEWVNNLMHGEGTYTFNDGCEYTGQYRDNEKHGHGVFRWPDGKRYEGQYMNNKRSGEGVFIMPDGTRIVGTWKDGKQDGAGKVISPSGKEQKAKWDMGILVQS